MTPIDVFTQVTFAPVSMGIIAITTGLYLYGVKRMAAKARMWPAYRTWLLLTGELALAFGLLSGIDAKDHLFSVYAIQHILIGIVAPLCFALSAPLTLLVRAGSDRVRDTTLAALDSRAARVIFNPFFTWAFFAASVMTLYLTGLYALSMRNDLANNLVHLDLILAGCLYWWPLIAADPIPTRLGSWAKILYLILAMPFFTILGMSLESESKGIAPGMSLTEVHTGGGLLWCAGEIMGLLGAIAFFVLWLRADEQAAKRSDDYSEEAAARQLAHWRATRDAAARAASS
jgi:putative copper resistance protein D